MKFMQANRIAPDGTAPFAASHLGLFCLHMSNKKECLDCMGLESLGHEVFKGDSDQTRRPKLIRFIYVR